MKPLRPSRLGIVLRLPAAMFLVSSLPAAPIVWDNSNATGAWSTPANWDTNTEPTSADDLTFPLGLAGTITTTSTENALSLTFADAYTLSGGTLALASGNSIHVASGVIATINNALTITGGLSKTGDGTLVLGGSNTNPGGTVISAGKIRAANAGALGAAGIVTTVNSATTLEVANGITLDRPITLMHGGTVAGIGTATNNGKITIDAAATAVTLATDSSTDVFSVGNGANDITGGSGSTVVSLSGPGAVRLGGASDFDGSWAIPTGRLELGAAAALGDQATTVTLSGGTLSARLNTATTFTGPAGNLALTTNATLLSDRTSAGAGVTHTLGTLSMGGNTLTVAPGANSTSGTAGITLGNVTLTGNPVFDVGDIGSANGKLTTGSLLGGAARIITKSGAGDLAITGGSTDLPAGSTFSATDGGNIEMLFPNLGASTTTAVSSLQNPLGEASISITDGALRLLADGTGNSTAQIYQISNAITLGGNITLDPDRRSGSNSNKTFELPAMTLAAGTVLNMSGNNTHGVRLTGALALSGDATLQGVSLANQDCQLTLGGGISGGVSDELTINGGTSPLNLTINASSTYGGGTTMTGGNVTLAAANALGTGTTTLSGGTLIVNSAGALNGTISLTGGTLRSNGSDLLASNPISLQGGTLDIRNNTTSNLQTGTLTVSGTTTLNVGNNGAGSSQVITIPSLGVSGDTTLTLTNANSFVPLFTSISLSGNLTLSNAITTRIQSISEDASPRSLIKTGTGTLELEGASTHSGGTEVLAGILLVEHSDALGSGALTLGATSGTAAATAQFSAGLTIPNNLIARSGGTGLLTIDAPSGGVTWNGNVDLQRNATFDNGSSTVSATIGGVISGAGNLIKASAGEISLTNVSNTFGSGAGAITINDGFITVASDGALGGPGGGVTLAGTDGVLKCTGTFSTSRTLTASGTSTGVNVTSGNEVTLNSAIAGSGTFLKGDAGTLTIAAGVDSSARSTASSGVTGGILRVQGITNLSNAGPVTLNGSSGTIEFLSDADTNFAHPVTADGTGTLHVDRAAGGIGNNGRHTLGTLGMASGSLTVTGANGYGLSLGAATISSSNTLLNNAPGALRIASLIGNPGSSNVTLTSGGSGDIEILGPLSEGAGTGNYGIDKQGAGTLRFGTSVAEFGRVLSVKDGILDLNGLSFPVTGAVTLGGAASTLGAEVVTGPAGALVLTSGLTFSSTTSPPGSRVTGNLDLGSTSQTLTVNDSSAASVDLTLNGPIIGSPGAALVKAGAGTLRMSGAGNTQPGLVTCSAGLLELAKSSGDAIGTGGLSISAGTVRSLANEQIENTASVSLSSANEVFLELNNFTETTGPLSLAQTDTNDYTAVKTGATGTLVLNGNLSLNNNTNSSFTDGREVLITGTGSEFAATTDGTLDLGGATRTIQVSTTTIGANEPKANATIETQIINGGILKTGARTLNLSHPNNTFSGGLQIAEGYVKPATTGSLGAGPVTFTNGIGVTAGIDFGSLTGTVPNTIHTGTGDFVFIYSAAAPNALTLSGGFSMEQDLTVNVVNGSVENGTPNDVYRAVVDVTGTIDDGAGTFALTKIGDGLLKLASGNTYSGATTVERGILSIAADSSLGDTTTPVTINGGCLAVSNSLTLTRDLAIGASGGSLRADNSRTFEIAGNLDWGTSTTGTDGAGRIVISGPTTGSGDLIIGESTAFASGSTGQQLTWFAEVCLSGPAALPSGNLSFGGNGVLELGNGDFTRALGTGPGQVQMPTNAGGGWAAVGADRVVNIGGAGATLTWGQTSPPFLYRDGPSVGDIGQLILGSPSATHTVEFQNPLVFQSTTSYLINRQVVCWDGAAAVDGRITGDAHQTDPIRIGDFTVTGDGTFEMAGDLLGRFGFSQNGQGTTILSGNNTGLTDYIDVFEGTAVLANDASMGAPESITLFGPGTLDASALTVPLTTAGYGQIFVVEEAQIIGNVQVNGSLSGGGTIHGNLIMSPEAYIYPDFDATLFINGDFSADPDSSLEFDISGTMPETQHTRIRVSGAVNLDGRFNFYQNDSLVENETVVLILNDGSDPINGQFFGLPEGAGISLGNGYAFQVTYQANGDGGPVGNDFAVTLVPDTFLADIAITVDAPLVVEPNESFTVTYTLSNLGPNPCQGGRFEVFLPSNATFTGSSPAGTVDSGSLWIDFPPISVGGSSMVTLDLTAPASQGSVYLSPYAEVPSGDADTGNNSTASVTAVIPGGVPVLEVFSVDTLNDELTLGIFGIQDVRYWLESSIDLETWSFIEEFYGGESPIQSVQPMDEPKEFFRFRIMPYESFIPVN
ncbi:unnamed protein product [Oikopleura dioica]|uniref:Autotransporter domain-containing protein n=1 Tax=Oikopleura dioica TaxID=34765 RepID=E4XU28_OIKDI|nr:unnamed protein product [Oikopleura dioica]